VREVRERCAGSFSTASINGKKIGVLSVLLVFFMAIGVAAEERTDASG